MLNNIYLEADKTNEYINNTPSIILDHTFIQLFNSAYNRQINVSEYLEAIQNNSMLRYFINNFIPLIPKSEILNMIVHDIDRKRIHNYIVNDISYNQKFINVYILFSTPMFIDENEEEATPNYYSLIYKKGVDWYKGDNFMTAYVIYKTVPALLNQNPVYF